MASCETCTFFNIFKGRKGECKRFPPQPVYVSGTRPPEVKSVWPEVDTHDYCGEYKQRSQIDTTVFGKPIVMKH